MEAKKKHYRKVPPYMTKTGIQIGLLHQEPFESRMDKDAYILQEALLTKKTYKYKDPMYLGDLVVGVVSCILLVALVALGFYHVL
jgi:hypothetical protein